MVYRPAVGIVNQYSVETTKGVGVPAVKRLTASRFVMSKERANDFFRAAGNLFFTSGVRHRAWSTGRLDGRLSYEEIHLYLAMMFGHGTVTTASGASTWPITVTSAPGNAYKTITGQEGDAIAAREVNYLSLISLDINLTGETASISGSAVGRNVDTAATLDTVTTTLPEQAVSIADVHYFIDTTVGGLGTTEWTDVFESTISLPTNKAPAFAHGSATFAELVETAMEGGRLTIRCANTAQARAIEDALDTDQKPFRYIRVNADGEIITGTTPYRFRANLAVKLESVTPIDNIQEAYGMEFVFVIMHSPDMGRAMDFSVTNTQPTL